MFLWATKEHLKVNCIFDNPMWQGKKNVNRIILFWFSNFVLHVPFNITRSSKFMNWVDQYAYHQNLVKSNIFYLDINRWCPFTGSIFFSKYDIYYSKTKTKHKTSAHEASFKNEFTSSHLKCFIPPFKDNINDHWSSFTDGNETISKWLEDTFISYK